MTHVDEKWTIQVTDHKGVFRYLSSFSGVSAAFDYPRKF